MKVRRHVCRAVKYIVVLAAAVTGCGGSGLKMIDYSNLPTRTATPNELVDRLNRDSASIAALKGKLGMGLQKGPGNEVRRCSGMILAENHPDRGLHLKGYKRLIPTFFTLVSDGNDFWFHIPRDDVVYTGPAEFAWSRDDSLELYLNAGDLSRALFVEPVDVAGVFDVQDEDSVYVLTVYARDARGLVERKLWIERKRFTVVYEVRFDEDGLAQLEIKRRKYADLEGRLYPSSLSLHDLVSGSSVFLDFNSITLDPKNVPESAFQFQAPDGVEVKPVEKTRTET